MLARWVQNIVQSHIMCDYRTSVDICRIFWIHYYDNDIVTNVLALQNWFLKSMVIYRSQILQLFINDRKVRV